MLTFRPFIPPYVFRGSEPIEVPQRKPLAVLVYLALEDRPVSRDEAAGILWPEVEVRRAKQSLRQALSTLRTAIAELDVEGDPLRPSGDAFEVVWDLPPRPFDGAALVGLVAELRGLGGRQWEHWLDDVEEGLRSRAAAVLRRDLGEEIEAGRWAGAVDAAESLVGVQPSDPSAWRRLAQVHIWNDDPDRAREALEEAEAHVPPERRSDLAQLQRRIRDMERTGRAGATAFEIPIVGRDGELSRLHAIATDAATGIGRAVAVVGRPGSGRTRLAAEVASRLEVDGWATAAVRATRAETAIPFGLVAQLVRQLIRRRGAAGISSASEILLHGLVPSRSDRQPPANVEPAALSDALLDLIDNVAFESPLLVVVDDLQWADRASMGVLSHVLHGIQDQRVLVLMVSDAGPGASIDLLPERVDRIELEPLTVHHVEALLVQADGPADDVRSLAADLHAQSGGNPLHVVEFLEGVRSPDRAAGDGIDWAEAVRRSRTPESTEEIVRRRLNRLDEGSRRVLREILAGPTSLTDLQARLGDPADLDDRLLHLLDSGLAQWTGDGRVDFKHDFVRKQLAEEETVRRQRRTRRALSTAVSAAALVVLLIIVGFMVSSPGAPYGGGRIVLMGSDGVHVVDVERGPPEEWERRRPDAPVPRDRELRFVSGDGHGGLMYWGYGVGPQGADVLRLYADERPAEALVAGPGDDTWQDASPDGRFFLHISENLATERYDTHLFRRRADGTAPVRIRGGESWITSARWSPDGRRVLYIIRSAIDTLVVADPAGNVVWKRPFGTVHRAAWCGGSEEIIVVARGDRTLMLASAAPGREGIDTLASGIGRYEPACSPDRSAVLFPAVREGRERMVFLDRETGEEHLTGWPPALRVKWIPESVARVRTGVEIVDDGIEMSWGGRKQLHAIARFPDEGSEPARDVSWRSLDPQVASVSPNGVAFANRPGRTRITATLDGWLVDTVDIAVRGDAARPPLMDDAFERWDSATWIAVGNPRPRVVDEGLDISGDGAFSDGIITRQDFELGTGATAEIEFRLPLTRRDRQSISFCFNRSDIAEGADGDEFNEWITEDQVCALYPAGELEKFDPSEVGFSLQLVRLPENVTTGDSSWTHLALQMRPDGRVDLFVDRTFVARSLRQFGATDRKPWRVRITGRAVDSQLVIRDFVLWPMTRFTAPAVPDPATEGGGAGP